MKKLFLLILITFVTTFGCANTPPTGGHENAIFETQDKTKFLLETVASGLEVPWGFAFLPNKDLLFTERPGRVRIIEGGKLSSKPVFTVPDVEPSSESGLMDISLHPNFGANGFVYLAYAYNNDGKHVKVVRYKYSGGTFTEPTTIVENIPGSPNHAGTRCRFGPE